MRKYFIHIVPIITIYLHIASEVCMGQITHFVHFGTESGLPQSQIQTINQDSAGNLWLGTLSGLTRYNGKEFVTFTKLDGLSEDWITTAYRDRKGNLWFGHWTGGISKYNILTNTFETIGLEEFLEFRSVSSILEDKEGNIWTGTYGSGVVKYEHKTNKILLINRINGLSSNNITCIMQDSYGNIWFGTDAGITIYTPSVDMNSAGAFFYLNTSNGLPSDFVNDIKQALGTQIWIALEGTGVFAVNVTDKITAENFRNLPQTIIRPGKGLMPEFVSKIYRDSRRNIWLATADTGVICFTPTRGKENSFPTPGRYSNYSTAHGLNYNRVNDIFEDREGNIWIATDLGLNRFRGEQFQLFDESYGITDNIVWSILADTKGNVWMGTNKGVSCLHPFSGDDGGTSAVAGNYQVTNYSVRNGLPANSVRSLYEDGNGTIWIGTAGGGVCAFDPGNNKFNSWSADDGIADNTVLSICEDPSGNIWFGTPRGASRYNPAEKSFNSFSSISGLGGNSIFRIFRDSRGDLWMGSLGGSLTLFFNQKFTTFNENHGLLHKFILSIAEDKSGNIWFGTYGGGIYSYNPESGDKARFTNYTHEAGLSTRTPYSIICDERDNLWIGSSNGIDRYDRKNNSFTHYGRTEGFMGIENNANAVTIDRLGNIWFGTIMGALKFNPSLEQPNGVEPVTSIYRIRINQNDTFLPDNPVLKYYQNTMSLYFIGVSLTNPAKVRYKYRLRGFEEGWSPEVSEGYVTYSNIPHGDYDFELIASNDAGVWNKNPVTFSFSITPPFWLTWWFYLVFVTVVVSLIYVVIRVRERNLIHEKRRLEHLVQERTQELAHKNRELAEKNKDITDSITYAKKIQEAMLPTESYWKKFLPESFILHRPKAIVSGDFYWLALPPSSPDGNTILFAACDCTGHGVPGAFMSMLCSSLLNEAVTEKKIVQPASILDEVRRGVISTLKQKGEYGEQQDGMDAALCCLSPARNGRLRLSGACANNGIWVLRPVSNNDDIPDAPFIVKHKNEKFRLYEIMPDRQPVAISMNSAPFSHYEFELCGGDTVYLFSDGIEDQFGGAQGKKFKASRLRSLLMNCGDKPMQDQLRIINHTVTEWMGKFEQLDDILLLGVRI
ncbi:MAG: SpoIIE family protein phosphatase [Bacteroidetes bacterium]|nr:SpoIIE family protein phosphatase [Bacteroidota bacterium]